jgi:hypothetical protein
LLDRSLNELAEQIAAAAPDDVATIERYAADIRDRRVPAGVRAGALEEYESVRPLADTERGMLTTFGGLAWIRADGRPMSRLAELLRDPYV